jgi:hypothetical protein
MNDIQKLHEIIQAYFDNMQAFDSDGFGNFTYKNVTVCPASKDKKELKWYWVEYEDCRILWHKFEGLQVTLKHYKVISEFNFTDWHGKVIEILNLLKK